MPPRFVLDQNFPLNILRALGYIPEVELVPLIEVNPALIRDHDDWEILADLHRRGLDGFITSDSSMLRLPKELSALIQTGLTLVVTEGVGHDSIEATGLLLMHLRHIAHQTHKGTAQLWRLRPPRRTNHSDPWETLRDVAEKLGQSVDALYRAERLPSRALE